MNEEVLMPFGKYSGTPISKVPKAYLWWLKEQGPWREYPDYLKSAIDCTIGKEEDAVRTGEPKYLLHDELGINNLFHKMIYDYYDYIVVLTNGEWFYVKEIKRVTRVYDEVFLEFTFDDPKCHDHLYDTFDKNKDITKRLSSSWLRTPTFPLKSILYFHEHES